MFRSKAFLAAIVLMIITLVSGACTEPIPPTAPEGNGTISVYVTDAPAREEVTGVFVTLSEVKVHLVTQEQEESTTDNQSQDNGGSWTTLDTGGEATFDLLEIQGIEQFLGTSNVTAGKYTQVRLVIDRIQVGLGDNDPVDAKLPSGELKLVHPFEVKEGEALELIIDFDAEKMVNVTGAGDIIVKPVVKLTTRKDKQAGKDEEEEPTEPTALEDMEWSLISYGDSDNLTQVLDDTEITATFQSSNGRISGNSGCNNYFANYEINQSELTLITPIGSTKKACPEPIMNQETEYYKLLEKIESFTIEGTQLRIVSGGEVLLFDRE